MINSKQSLNTIFMLLVIIFCLNGNSTSSNVFLNNNGNLKKSKYQNILIQNNTKDNENKDLNLINDKINENIKITKAMNQTLHESIKQNKLIHKKILENQERNKKKLDFIHKSIVQKSKIELKNQIFYLTLSINKCISKIRKINKKISFIREKINFKSECDKLDSCQKCSQNSKCGWCSLTSTCVEGNEKGPLNGSCSFYEYKVCSSPRNCNAYSDCNDCLKNVECGWCNDGEPRCLDRFQAEKGKCSGTNFIHQWKSYNTCPHIKQNKMKINKSVKNNKNIFDDSHQKIKYLKKLKVLESMKIEKLKELNLDQKMLDEAQLELKNLNENKQFNGDEHIQKLLKEVSKSINKHHNNATKHTEFLQKTTEYKHYKLIPKIYKKIITTGFILPPRKGESNEIKKAREVLKKKMEMKKLNSTKNKTRKIKKIKKVAEDDNLYYHNASGDYMWVKECKTVIVEEDENSPNLNNTDDEIAPPNIKKTGLQPHIKNNEINNNKPKLKANTKESKTITHPISQKKVQNDKIDNSKKTSQAVKTTKSTESHTTKTTITNQKVDKPKKQ